MKKSHAFIFILLSVLFQSLAAVLGKYAALSLDAFTPHGFLTNGFYMASLVCMGLQAICWPLALRHFDLFWAYLFMSVIFIVIPLSSYFLFHETVTPGNVAGALVIMIGIIVMFKNQPGRAS